MAKKNFIPNNLKLYYKNEKKEYSPNNFKSVFVDFINFIEHINKLNPNDNIFEIVNKIRNIIFPNYKTNPFISFKEEDFFIKNKGNSVFVISENGDLGVYTVHSEDKLIYRFHLIIEQLSIRLKDFNCIIEQGTKKDDFKKEEKREGINNKAEVIIIKENENKREIKKELKIKNIKSIKKNKSIRRNTILLSNPNSGKTYTVKEIIGDSVNFELSFQNNDNVLEWKKNILFKNINGEIIIGNIIKAIASATLNPTGDYFVFADEVGTFFLDNIMGNILKSIFKNTQKIKIKMELIRDYKDLDEITLKDFIKLGEAIKKENKYSTTTFNEEEFNIPLWIPSNLNFIFCANYENELIESLSPLKGWGEKGDRFKVKHFYNLTGKEFFKIDVVDKKILVRTKKYNEIIIKKYNELILNENLSSDSKKTLNTNFNKYKILLANYDSDILYSSNEKEYVINHIEDYIYSLFLDEEDEELIIEEFREVI